MNIALCQSKSTKGYSSNQFAYWTNWELPASKIDQWAWISSNSLKPSSDRTIKNTCLRSDFCNLAKQFKGTAPRGLVEHCSFPMWIRYNLIKLTSSTSTSWSSMRGIKSNPSFLNKNWRNFEKKLQENNHQPVSPVDFARNSLTQFFRFIACGREVQ